MARSNHIPVLMPVAFVARLNCHWPSAKRNRLPVVAVPCAVAVTEKDTGRSRSTLHGTEMPAGQAITGGVTSGAALYTSAEARTMPESSTPPATSTLPSERRVAVELLRPVLMLAVGDQVPRTES